MAAGTGKPLDRAVYSRVSYSTAAGYIAGRDKSVFPYPQVLMIKYSDCFVADYPFREPPQSRYSAATYR